MAIANIDPNRPSQEEIARHNIKVAKANLTCDLVKFIVGNMGFFHQGKPSMDPIELVRFATATAEGAVESFSMMPDSDGKRGGVVS